MDNCSKGVDLPWDIICNILSRIPTLSLLRFSTVSKTLCNLRKDPCFIDMHQNFVLARPHSRGFILYGSDFTEVLTNSYNMEESNGQWKFRQMPLHHILQGTFTMASCNGLLCLTGKGVDCLRKFVLYNPVTGESLTLPKFDFEYYSVISISFGYDVKNKKYKVVVLVDVLYGVGDGISYTEEGYIHIIGESSWRKLSLPAGNSPQFDYYKNAVNFNGELYWISRNRSVILAMDLSNEKFRAMTPPYGFKEEYSDYLVDFGGDHLNLIVCNPVVVDVWILVVHKEGKWNRQSTVPADIWPNEPAKGCYPPFRVVGSVGDDSLLLLARLSSQDGNEVPDQGESRLGIYNTRTKELCMDLSGPELSSNFNLRSYVPTLISLKM